MNEDELIFDLSSIMFAVLMNKYVFTYAQSLPFSIDIPSSSLSFIYFLYATIVPAFVLGYYSPNIEDPTFKEFFFLFLPVLLIYFSLALSALVYTVSAAGMEETKSIGELIKIPTLILLMPAAMAGYKYAEGKFSFNRKLFRVLLSLSAFQFLLIYYSVLQDIVPDFKLTVTDSIFNVILIILSGYVPFRILLGISYPMNKLSKLIGIITVIIVSVIFIV